MIRRAIGLGLIIIVLNILAPKVLSAVETTIVSLLTVIGEVGENIPKSMPALLHPAVPAR